MDRVAVFVDAGYLFAQGSVALAGVKRRRTDLIIDAPAVISELKSVAASACACSLLRIYWYDGTVGANRLTADQARLAILDDVKIRLGFINSQGQQKGVDSLIVTDLIELARQKSICDAVLMSGDEDVRVGVQIAQSYGVRIHLLGIAPTRSNQSQQLMQEADTRREWHVDVVRRFLSERQGQIVGPSQPLTPTAATAPAPVPTPYQQNAPTQVGASSGSNPLSFDPRLELKAKEFVDALQQVEVESLDAYWKTARGLPPEFDRRLLPEARSAIGRDLSGDEKRFVRARVQKMVKDRAATTP